MLSRSAFPQQQTARAPYNFNIVSTSSSAVTQVHSWCDLHASQSLGDSAQSNPLWPDREPSQGCLCLGPVRRSSHLFGFPARRRGSLHRGRTTSLKPSTKSQESLGRFTVLPEIRRHPEFQELFKDKDRADTMEWTKQYSDVIMSDIMEEKFEEEERSYMDTNGVDPGCLDTGGTEGSYLETGATPGSYLATAEKGRSLAVSEKRGRQGKLIVGSTVSRDAVSPTRGRGLYFLRGVQSEEVKARQVIAPCPEEWLPVVEKASIEKEDNNRISSLQTGRGEGRLMVGKTSGFNNNPSLTQTRKLPAPTNPDVSSTPPSDWYRQASDLIRPAPNTSLDRLNSNQAFQDGGRGSRQGQSWGDYRYPCRTKSKVAHRSCRPGSRAEYEARVSILCLEYGYRLLNKVGSHGKASLRCGVITREKWEQDPGISRLCQQTQSIMVSSVATALLTRCTCVAKVCAHTLLWPVYMSCYSL